MNNKTAKLLNRYATVNKMNARVLKRVWSALPHNKRHEQRTEMKRLIAV